MLRKRIIGAILIENGFVVRRVGFKTKAIIGKPEVTVRYLQNWGIDEVSIINVGEKSNGFLKILEYAAKNIFVPVSAGGSIFTKEDAKDMMCAGADKVILGKYATERLCDEIATTYGAQAVCVSIDENHKKKVKKVLNWNCGEIILHDKERDGLGNGLNLNILKINSSKPVIAMGGVGKYEDISEGLLYADAVSVGNLFHFKEIAAKEAKKIAREKGIIVRS